MDPGKHDFTIWAGATFNEIIEWRTPDGATVDLSLYNGRMEIRGGTGTTFAARSAPQSTTLAASAARSAGPQVATAAAVEPLAVGGPLLIALTTVNGGIVIQPDKRALLFIDDDVTRVMATGVYSYDLLFERIADDFVFAVLQGSVTVKPLVTQVEP